MGKWIKIQIEYFNRKFSANLNVMGVFKA